MISIENDLIKVQINEKGAELSSLVLKKTATEYVWQGDPAFWKGRAPNLFPIAGGLKGGTVRYQDKDWAIPRHGFARDMVFNIRNQQTDRVEFELVDSEQTRAFYPFAFRLTISYSLKTGSNRLEQSYRVENTAPSADLYFSVGAHTGFNCPLTGGEKFQDYYLEFDKPETLDRGFMKDNLLCEKKVPFIKNSRTVELNPELFADGAIVLENTASQKITLASRRSTAKVEVDFAGFPWLVLWSAPGASFVCIEPWQAINDGENAVGVLERKPGIIRLAAGKNQVFTFGMAIS